MIKTVQPNLKQQGFTLIELLVVVLVIGALSGVLLGVINSSGVRAKARDAQRKADITKIQTALELYFADNRTYPVSNNGGGPDTFEQVDPGATNVIIGALQPNYIDPVPPDPSAETGNEDTPCDDATLNRYNYRSDGSYYWLTTIMEITTSNEDSACAAQVGCAIGYATEDFCYFAQNP